MRVSSEGFLDVACGSMRLRNKREDTFKEHFTFSPKVVSHAWNEMTRKGLLPKGAAPYHLLWMLYFVKNYTNNATGGTASQSCKETFRKWCRLLGIAASKLDKVQQQNLCASNNCRNPDFRLTFACLLSLLHFRYIGVTDG
jgi:hypothetical protein